MAVAPWSRIFAKRAMFCACLSLVPLHLHSANTTIADGFATNVRLVEGSGDPGSITLGAAITTINTLNQSGSGGASPAIIDTAGRTLAVNGILQGRDAGGLTIGNGAGSGTLMPGIARGELLIENYGSSPLIINAVIANNNGISSLSIAGPGKTILTATNTYTGATTISGGTLQLALGSRCSQDHGSSGALPGRGGRVGRWLAEPSPCFARGIRSKSASEIKRARSQAGDPGALRFPLRLWRSAR